MAQVGRHRGPGTRPEEHDPGAREVRVLGGGQVHHRPDEHHPGVPVERAGGGEQERHVEPVGVHGPDVERDPARREVGRAGERAAVAVEVDPVRQERHVAGRSLAGDQPGGAHRDLGAPVQQRRLVLDEARVLGGGAVGGQPVVGDVVERGPARAPHDGGAGRVVDPQHRAAQAGAGHGTLDRPREPDVHARVDLAGEPLGRLVEEHAAGGDPVHGGRGAQTAAGARDAAPTEPVQRVGRRLDEQHPGRRVGAAQLRDEVLVAAPHVVPAFERQDDDVARARTARGGRHASTAR